MKPPTKTICVIADHVRLAALRKCLFVVLCVIACGPVAHATVMEVGDLNIIVMAGNPSNGLRFLDMTFSVGKTEGDALTAAQGSYSNARLATAPEFDDLFLAAGISYNFAAFTAADAFEMGSNRTISIGSFYDGGVLLNQLGTTGFGVANIWTVPDGNVNVLSTRDRLHLNPNNAQILQEGLTPANSSFGWLLVSDSQVPTPPTLVLFGIGLAALGFRPRRAVPPSNGDGIRATD